MNSMVSPAGLPAELMVPRIVGRGALAARDFESYLIGSLLESLQRTFSGLPGERAAAGADHYSYLSTQAMAGAIAAGGGFGIAEFISRHLPSHEGNDDKVSNGNPGEATPPKVLPSPADGSR